MPAKGKSQAQGLASKDPRLGIFLGYGHDGNEELDRRIKADQEKRGRDVWFDKSEIKFGDEWRRSITDGIVGSHRVLSFLSGHSTCDPGVCRLLSKGFSGRQWLFEAVEKYEEAEATRRTEARKAKLTALKQRNRPSRP